MRVKRTKKDLGDYSDIKERFREIRLDNRMTQVEMGQLVGLTASAIGAIEQGLYTPNFAVLRALNQKLGISYAYIIDGVKDNASDLLRHVKELEEENAMLKKVVAKLTK